jgi:aminoglycoside phosphotransferase family enzyme/predicted kinase
VNHPEAIHHPLIRTLTNPEIWPHPAAPVEVVETHISYVLLAGEFAYKIKKELNLGFLDFSTLELRKHFCEEELRINRRLAPAIYLEVVPITGSVESPRIGGSGTVIEYAVKMRRFPAGGLLSRRPEGLTSELVESVARRVARFHRTAAVCGEDQPYGSPEYVLQPMAENFAQIRRLQHTPEVLAQLERLEKWTPQCHAELIESLVARKRDGFIRECHGDLHLGNITLVDGEPVIFDAIEFNPGLRWIDTINEIAFLVMDLEEKGRPELAQRALNVYLEESGDFEGLELLRFYLVYRAMVRAKVAAIRLEQEVEEGEELFGLRREFHTYLELAERYTRPPRAALMITHGPSGAGKSVAARFIATHLPAIQIRSDVERKRLAGMPAWTRTASGVAEGIYSEEFSQRTYQRLYELAGRILAAGFSVVVDAAFLKQERREPFRRLARERGVPFLILDLRAPESLLRERLRVRQAAGADPSEADETVLERQLATAEPLTPKEGLAAFPVPSDAAPPITVLRQYLFRK